MADYGEVETKERLTGRAYFAPAGGAGSIDLGNIQLLKLEYAPRRKQHYKMRHGRAVLDRDDAYGAEPKFTIECDEFVSSLLPLIFLGTANPDHAQTAAESVLFTFTAQPGQSLQVGAFGITNAVVTVPAGTTPGADHVIDGGPGRIYIPLTSAIAAGTSVTLRYDRPALEFDSINAFDRINRLGTMGVLEEDEYSLVPRSIYLFSCSLTTDSAGETKPDDFKKVTLIATITGPLAVLKRPNIEGATWLELLFDDDSVMELA